MSSDNSLTYVTVLGPGRIAEQALHLIRSIHLVEDEPDIMAFIAEEEKDELDEEILEEVRGLANVIEGELPISEKPMTAKQAALIQASGQSDSEYLALVDSDSILLERISVHEHSDADIFLKPAAAGRLYWPSQESQSEWEKISRITGEPLPEERLVSTVEKLPIRSYWNGGFILTRNNGFPRKWLEIIEKIHGKITHDFFTEQVALPLAAQHYDIEVLGEKHNFPGNFRLRCPPGTVNIHYRSYPHLYKLMLFNPWLIEEVAETGVIDRIDAQKDLYFYWDVLYKIGRNAKIKLLGFR